MYDYFLGGKDNFAADRETANKALGAWPAMRTAARENRAFLGRAVRYLTEEAGISQFLDVGSGLPGVGNVHEVAQAVNPAARVVYVDNDPIVLAHGRALLRSTPPGSYVTASHATSEFAPATLETGQAYTRRRGDVTRRDHDVFADLAFRGRTLVPPGVVVVSEWRPGPHAFLPPRGDVSNNGAVARKP